MNSETENKSASQPLENLRKRLLDLSGRNRLLNFRHTKTSSLRVVDELPNQLIDTLLADKEMTFNAVPEPTREQLIEAGYIIVDEEEKKDIRIKKDPTAEEWARHLGYDTSYALPIDDGHDEENKHHDSAIQTLFYPYELETRLRNLRTKSKTAIEETGSNILYLVLGFLEWHDRDREYIAPLFLCPVRLERGKMVASSRTYEYRLSYSGEDIFSNLSLKEKLSVDFNIALPALDENTFPENYFEEVREIIQEEKPHWKVHRHITLTLLNFSKLLMYLDLNPTKWPAKQNILTHSIVTKFLSGYSENSEEEYEEFQDGFSEEYEIDNIENIHSNYPIIEDADSSQHSALIDVVNGKNLVIEGPPGTGKSQTITNVIAALLAQNKKVLFVAEKLAALEVVKQRLDRAGLGQFCLELHSHKTQKRKMIEDLANRLEKKGTCRTPADIDADIARYEDLKSKLRTYVECVNSEYKNTGKTIHEILMAATRYREKVNISPDLLHPQNLNGENFTTSKQREVQEHVEVFAEGYAASLLSVKGGNGLESHPWFGIHNTDIQIFDFEIIKKLLLDWQQSLESLIEYTPSVFEILQVNEEQLVLETTNDFNAILQSLKKIPNLTGEEILRSLPHLNGSTLEKFINYIAVHKEIQSLYSSLSQSIEPNLLNDLSFVTSASKGLKKIESLFKLENTLSPLEAIQSLERLSNGLKDILTSRDEISSCLPENSRKLLGLNTIGIEELKTFVEIVCSLKPSLWKLRDDVFDNEELDELLPQLHEHIESLKEIESKLGNDFRLEKLPSQEELTELQSRIQRGGFFRFLNSDWKSAKRDLCSLSTNPNIKIKAIIPILDELIDYKIRKESFLENKEYKNHLPEHFEGLDTDTEKILELREWYHLVRQKYGVGFGPKVVLGNSIIDLQPSFARSIRSLEEFGFIEKVSEIQKDFEVVNLAFRGFNNSPEGDYDIIGDETSVLGKLQSELTSALSDCGNLINDEEFSLPSLLRNVNDLEKLKKHVDVWIEADHDNRLFDGELGLRIGVGVDNTTGLSKAEHTISLAKALQDNIDNTILIQRINDDPNRDTFDLLFRLRDTLGKFIAKQNGTFEAYTEKVSLNFAEWTAHDGESIVAILKKNAKAIAHEQTLQTYLDYTRTKSHLIKIGFKSLSENVEAGNLSSDDIIYGSKLGIYDFLSRSVFQEYSALAYVSGLNQESMRKQFSEYDEKLKKLQRERIAAIIDKNPVPSGRSGGRVSQYTDLVLIRNECGKKKRHIPIRQLVKRAGDALSALKPCFMMGPMSVAQYLEPGKFLFDVVVMDEASQIKPEDALGTIARGTRLVVVGDPKQLPPTNFFNRLVQDEEEDHTGIEESESILDATLPIFNSRRLRWHYRSQHESLIAFSNYSFYNNNLVLFPSPNIDSNLYGINYRRLKRGCFTNRRNNREAEAIAEAVKEHFDNHFEETLGIVAMSADQRDQIERAIEQFSKEDSYFRQLLERDEQRPESLFVKNLENVQGDERDVIFISMTYGPVEVGGKVFQRFGPINSDVGWRRLNVLFTRSRKRMHVFSSMNSSDIVVSGKSSKGVRALRDFLAYCESGKLHQTIEETDRPPDSDFEISVMEALGAHGFVCVPQVGIAGFFIDIAVRDPGNPGSYLMGIECDGATYHSAKSVRDRDRLRQNVLENLGWNIQRIWSTDWFKNPNSQIEPIVTELRKLQTEPVSVDGATIFSDDDAAEFIEMPHEESVSVSNAATPVADDDLIDNENETVDKLSSEEIDLRDKLIKFDQEVIQKEAGEVAENKQLLREAMLDALTDHMPASKSEFLELIPLYLRENIDPSHGKYLSAVLDIVSAEYNE